MKYLVLAFVLIFTSTSFAAKGEILLTCTAQTATSQMAATEWVSPALEGNETKTLTVEGEAVELAIYSLFGTTAVTINVAGEDDEVVPRWNTGASRMMKLSTGRDVQITCYYQHDD